MAGSTKSWAQLVREADPNYEKERREYPVYSYSNGRKFIDKPNPYSN